MTTTQKFAKFTASKEDRAKIKLIVARAIKMALSDGIAYEQQNCWMDLEACHCNGCPLDLIKLLEAPEADFGHDVYGIRRFINRMTGELKEFFVPRCAL